MPLLSLTADSGTLLTMREDYMASERKTIGLIVNFLKNYKETL